MSAADAAGALGVSVQTVYAYVSRGVLARVKVPGADGRLVSRFDRTQVLQVARSRRPSRIGRVADLIESDVTQLDPAGVLSYRGIDVEDLVERGFEETVRTLLATTAPWPKAGTPRGRGCRASDPMDTIRRGLLDAAAEDPDRADIGPAHCRKVGLVAVEVACSAVTGLTADVGPVAYRLAAVWTRGARATGGVERGDDVDTVPREVVAGIDAALCVLADHDLTGSTLATRAAAGVHADPWMALLAGHAALGGSRQGSSSVAAVDLLRAWRTDRSTSQAWFRRPGPLPGFGHLVYEGPDPRAVAILHATRRIAPAVVDDVESLTVEVARHHSRHPNVDIALAALVLAIGLPDVAGTTLYGIGRLAGLAAHAIEEYPHDIRLRPRSVPVRPSRG